MQFVLEIGCAYGVSSIVISEALSRFAQDPFYIILDPYQSSYFNNCGIHNLNLAGFNSFELLERGSELALPEFLTNGNTFDFIFQDGMKTMDHSMLEFHYLDRLLRVGGVLVYDDVDRWHMNRFIRYISQYPHWKIIACAGQKWQSLSRKSLSMIKSMLCPLFSFIPRTLALEFLSDSLLRSDKSLGLNSSMIALRKVADDPRDYTWNTKF